MSNYARFNSPVLHRLVEPKQYTALRYSERLADVGCAGFDRQRRGSYDNAMAESVVGL